jgi:hypothetical protein
MERDRKRFSRGWFTGLVLGTVAAGGAAVYAVTIPHTFQDGQTARAQQVNENFEALRTAIDACQDGMVRVGSTCIDSEAQVATSIPPECQPGGQGCSGIVTGTGPGIPYSWGQAVAACTNAGKRLATGREVIAAFNAGLITLAENTFLYADASAARNDLPYAGTYVVLRPGGIFQLGGTTTSYTEAFPNPNANVTVAFRCAR